MNFYSDLPALVKAKFEIMEVADLRTQGTTFRFKISCYL
jgi:hypothetical protein